MTRKSTIARALAYIAITGDKSGLHFNTRIALVEYTSVRSGLTGPLFRVSDEGMALARTSPMWRAHEALTAAGFKLDNGRRRRSSPGYISYMMPEPALTKTGKTYTRVGFISRSGKAYIDVPSDTTGSGWEMKELTT